MSDQGFTIELADCTNVLVSSAEHKGTTQKQMACLYAMAIVSSEEKDWLAINTAIRARWPKGLERIKKMAWQIIEKGGAK